MLEQIATIEICVVPEITNARYLLGLFFIFLQCLVWIGTSVLTQYMFDETSFSSPFVMTYVGVALLSLLLPFNYLNERFSDRSSSPTLHSVNSEDSFAKELDNARAYGEILDVMTTRSVQHARTAKPWNHKKHILAALKYVESKFLTAIYFFPLIMMFYLFHPTALRRPCLYQTMLITKG
jgi:solute carrier family 35 protein F5